MKDLRSELRSAFEKEQAANPPASDLRRTVVAATPSYRRGATGLQWVAVTAAILIAALVVVSLMSSRGAFRTQRPAHPSPLASVAIGEDYGPPPPGVPLVYLRDPYNAGWYTGFDWSGTPRGTIKLGQQNVADATLIQSPDGSYFVFSPSGKGSPPGALLDRLGKPVSGAVGMWADDGRHTCSVAFERQSFTWTLVTGGPNQASRDVAVIARDSNIGQTGIAVAACSFKSDRVIAVRTTVNWPSEMWVIRLSDGQVAKPVALSNPEELANLVASADGSLVAENSAMAVGKLNTSNRSTVIRRVADGSVVLTLNGMLGVQGFSADDSRALVSAPVVGGQTSYLEVIDLATGKVIWRYDTDKQLVGLVAQPGGAGFAVLLSGLTYSRSFPVTALIVRGDGSSVDLPAGYLRP